LHTNIALTLDQKYELKRGKNKPMKRYPFKERAFLINIPRANKKASKTL